MAQPSIVKILWQSGAMRILPGLFLAAFAFGVVYPLVPSLATDYFASMDVGHEVHCEAVEAAARAATPPSKPSHLSHLLSHTVGASHSRHPAHPFSFFSAPVSHSHDDVEACHNAHSTAVYWSSTTSFFSNTIVAFLVAPLLGDLSDRYGRKPLFILGLVLSCLPLVAVFGYLYELGPFYLYYVANAAANTNSILSASSAFMADKLEGRQRAAGFGLIVAVMFVGFSVAPLVGVTVAPTTACWVGLCGLVLSILYIAVFMNESLPPEAKAKAQKEPLTMRTLGTFKLFGFLGRSSLFIKLAICLCLLGVAQEGLQDLLLQYLQLKVNFMVVDQGVLFAVLGLSNLFVQTVVVSFGVNWFGEQRMLVIGLAFFIVYQLMLGLVTTKMMAFVAVGLGSLSGVTFPAISTLKANNCGPEEQGMLQGALNGLRAISQGIGPLIFALLFSLFTRTDSELPYIPGMPFFFSCFVTLGALVVACTIHPDAGMGLKAEEARDSNDSGRMGSSAVGNEDEEEARQALLGGEHEAEEQGYILTMESMKLREAMGAAAGQISSLDHP